VVAEKGKDGTDEAARFLLEKAGADDWVGWFMLAARAEAEGVKVEAVEDGVRRIELWRKMMELGKEIGERDQETGD
jgi:hypothetical protein